MHATQLHSAVCTTHVLLHLQYKHCWSLLMLAAMPLNLKHQKKENLPSDEATAAARLTSTHSFMGQRMCLSWQLVLSHLGYVPVLFE